MTSILVVDDRASDRELLAIVLRHAGYEVTEAATGREAIDLAKKTPPDLILADVLMPEMDGYELARALRSDPRTEALPIVFCSATYVLDDVRRLADGCGVPHILVKPAEPDEIVRVVGDALAATSIGRPPLPAEAFHREQLRVMNATLLRKIEELEAAERRGAESLTLLETLQSSAPVGFGFVDREFRVRLMNSTLAALKGIPVSEQLGQRVPDLTPALWPRIERLFRQVLTTGEPVVNRQVENLGARNDGRVALVSCYPVRVGGEVTGVGLVLVDITERRQAEELRSVVMDNMAEGLYVLDGEGRVLLLNAAASKLLGWGEDELRGKVAHDAFHYQRADGSSLPVEQSEMTQVWTEGKMIRSLDDAFTSKTGSIIPIAYSAAPLLNGSSVRGAVVVFRDITAEKSEQTRLERELNAVTWVGRIRDALDDNRMVLYAQPIVPLDGGEPREELLLRMVDRDGKIIPPGSFLPSAEKYGLIGEIDKWVVSEALDLASDGRRVDINLSAESVGDPEVLRLIQTQLRKTGVCPSRIVFEITETALMRDIEAGERFAVEVADLGCRLALDDFGTGFGSFTYLKRLPIHYLKIDIDFVRELATNTANQHVVSAIVSLAQGLGQETIAEGVEDDKTLSLLRQFGVDFAQGYHIGRPAPVATAGQGTRVA